MAIHNHGSGNGVVVSVDKHGHFEKTRVHRPQAPPQSSLLHVIIDTLLPKFILEVCGAAGAVWGFSECIGLRTIDNNWFWRPLSLLVAVVFGMRWWMLYVEPLQQESHKAVDDDAMAWDKMTSTLSTIDSDTCSSSSSSSSPCTTHRNSRSNTPLHSRASSLVSSLFSGRGGEDELSSLISNAFSPPQQQQRGGGGTTFYGGGGREHPYRRSLSLDVENQMTTIHSTCTTMNTMNMNIPPLPPKAAASMHTVCTPPRPTTTTNTTPSSHNRKDFRRRHSLELE